MPSADVPKTVVPSKCRACQGAMDSPLFCSNCRTLHAAEGLNHFELLGLPAAYELDPAGLRRRYLQNSRDIHPDHHGQCPADAELSLRTAARLNEAYRVLVDPLLRAEYLLELAGGKSAADDRSVPEEVLTRTLALREELEAARATGDQAAAAVLHERVRALYEAAAQAVAELARRLPGTVQVQQELRQKLNAVKYYRKLRE